MKFLHQFGQTSLSSKVAAVNVPAVMTPIELMTMNYQAALNKQLPIGSGEIESSHRSVVQKRLKIPGAWWKEENANAMFQLRINRFNSHWEAYWQLQKLAA